MYRIALEEHFAMNDPAHIDRWRSTAQAMPPAALQQVQSALTDVGDGRLEAMAHAGVDFAVLSNAGSVQGVLDPTAALRLARQANDFLAGAVRRHPDRFGGFATVPLQDPKAGADELARAVTQLGLHGTMLFGQTNGTYLDDDRYQPFWERAQDLGVPVYLHAADPMVVPRSYFGCDELRGPVWSWAAETSTHVLRMILNGVFERFPKVTRSLGHMGETLPYLVWRLDHRAQVYAASTHTPYRKPSDALKANVLVTSAGVFADDPLACALRALGEDRVMFSVDYPFERMGDAARWLDAAPVSDGVRERIAAGTARRVFGLAARTSGGRG